MGEEAKAARKAKATKGTNALAQRNLQKGKMRKLTIGTLSFILPKRRSDDHFRTTPEIMCGVPRVLKNLSPPATDATIAASRDQAHWSATGINAHVHQLPGKADGHTHDATT
jgi:hypothetical protein